MTAAGSRTGAAQAVLMCRVPELQGHDEVNPLLPAASIRRSNKRGWPRRRRRSKIEPFLETRDAARGSCGRRPLPDLVEVTDWVRFCGALAGSCRAA